MEDDPLENSIRYWAIYFIVLGVILFIGWRQPLRYRFMSKEAIYVLEHPATPTPIPRPGDPGGATPTPKWWEVKRKNPLDR